MWNPRSPQVKSSCTTRSSLSSRPTPSSLFHNHSNPLTKHPPYYAAPLPSSPTMTSSYLALPTSHTYLQSQSNQLLTTI